MGFKVFISRILKMIRKALFYNYVASGVRLQFKHIYSYYYQQEIGVFLVLNHYNHYT